jgi:hypothetical protein
MILSRQQSMLIEMAVLSIEVRTTLRCETHHVVRHVTNRTFRLVPHYTYLIIELCSANFHPLMLSSL